MRTPIGITIAGRHNPLIKRIRAIARSGLLLDAGDVLLETPRLIHDAMASGARIHTVLIRGNALTRKYIKQLLKPFPLGTTCIELEPHLFSSLTTTGTSAGILALASAPSWHEADLFAVAKPLILVVARVLDPGNLGTILRAAEAFGVTGVLITKDTVNPFNAKAYRAAAGSVFRLPMLLDRSTQDVIALLRRKKIPLLVSTAHGGKPVAETDIVGSVALALGSEGAGLPREFDEAGIRVTIPMARRVESLNVAIAAAVLLYEIALERTAAKAMRGETR